jgi:CheY-like chemotaxis protein
MDMLSIVVRCSVTDTGIGMTPIQVKGLFQPFSQASASTTRQFGGTGLGLAISKKIVEIMNGSISCQSEPEKGTTFTFTARFGIPLEGEVVTVDDSTEIRTDALLAGDYPHEQAVMRHYIELLRSKVYQIGAKPEEFKTILDTGKIRDIDFIVFDCSDLQKSFVPVYTMMREKGLEPMPVCVITEHPKLESVLDELGIKDSVHILKKPVIAGDLFNTVSYVADHKKNLRQGKKPSASQIAFAGKQEVEIPPSIKGAKILLAEDNKINQMVATELLKIKGFETTAADNGRLAVELLHKQEFDLILMDIQMPEMDGYEATRIIRSDPRFFNIPILAMTANAMSGDRELCLEAGMNDHVAKPIDPTVLYSALVKWIRK